MRHVNQNPKLPKKRRREVPKTGVQLFSESSVTSGDIYIYIYIYIKWMLQT